jgi:RNA polymerase sigma-70 factor (ECF subfamily)
MKIKYEFATETVEIEVSEDWGTVLVDLDRLEYNNEKKESRRHCSLEAYGENHEEFYSDTDMFRNLVRKEQADSVCAAMAQLKPSHRELIHALYFEGVSNEEYARRCGVAPAAISQRKNTAIKKLKKLFGKTLIF